jgi:hypothetical protein
MKNPTVYLETVTSWNQRAEPAIGSPVVQRSYLSWSELHFVQPGDAVGLHGIYLGDSKVFTVQERVDNATDISIWVGSSHLHLKVKPIE